MAKSTFSRFLFLYIGIMSVACVVAVVRDYQYNDEETGTLSPAIAPLSGDLVQNVFVLPGDGIPNNNGSIGPFCCTGETVIVQRRSDRLVLGYAYFYRWAGQAYNAGNDTSYAPNLILEFATMDPVPLKNSSSISQAKGQISFEEGQVVVGMQKELSLGALTYRVKILVADHAQVYGHDMFNMGTLKVQVTVDFADGQICSSP